MESAVLTEIAKPHQQSSPEAAKPPGPNVAVVGLGYVGLPLAVELGRHFSTLGFDVSAAKVAAYREGTDPTGEVSREQLTAARWLRVSSEEQSLREADFIIVAVPTPVDTAHNP